ncbi:MAG: gfo/Idh/MocA family oxidoreductase, partial [Halobacteriaceae archaeon]
MLGEYLDEFTRRDWQETSEGTVRLALVGLGWWVRDEAIPAIEESDFCTATVAVSGSAGKAERVADDHGMAAGVTYDQYHDGAAAEEYDAVYVC